MSRDDDDNTAAAHESEPLIQDADDAGGPAAIRLAIVSDGDGVDESTLGAPGLFIWALTFSAGVSGLLFGYEYVSVLHHLKSRNPRRKSKKTAKSMFLTAPASYHRPLSQSAPTFRIANSRLLTSPSLPLAPRFLPSLRVRRQG